MSYGIINQEYLTNIANAIRTKLGVATTYTPAEMPDAIASISGGGITPTGTKSITANGTYDVTNYASAEVAVPTGSSADLGTKSITANGTYNASDDSLEGYSQVTVNVSGGGGASSWLPASAELVASEDETINLSTDTSWDSITPSTTQQDLLAATDARTRCAYTLTAEQTANKAVIAVAHGLVGHVYTSSPEVAFVKSVEVMTIAHYCMLDLANLDDYGLITNSNTNREVFVNESGNTGLIDGSIYNGIIAESSMTLSTSSTKSTTPTVGLRRPKIRTKCSTSTFSTEAAALIDSANTNIVFKYRLYLVDKADSPLYACFDATNGIIS